jgi:molybdate transport system substrate-binding protein
MSRLLSTLFALSTVGFFTLSAAPQTTVLTVAAASDLSNLEPDLMASFRKSEPGLSVRFVTAASGVLSQQIQNGAPYDVFLSANAQFVDRLASNGKLRPDSVITYAVGRLGVLWRDGHTHPLRDLTRTWVRFVAVPNPKLAPYGQAAVQALQHKQIWEQVQPKVVYGENVRQTLQLFESGNADAVLTADSLLGGKHPDVVPDSWHQPIVQKAAAVAVSKHQDAADRFLIYLKGPAAQAVFARYGFSTLTPQTQAP